MRTQPSHHHILIVLKRYALPFIYWHGVLRGRV